MMGGVIDNKLHNDYIDDYDNMRSEAVSDSTKVNYIHVILNESYSSIVVQNRPENSVTTSSRFIPAEISCSIDKIAMLASLPLWIVNGLLPISKWRKSSHTVLSSTYLRVIPICSFLLMSLVSSAEIVKTPASFAPLETCCLTI